jgi:hypothetical protein
MRNRIVRSTDTPLFVTVLAICICFLILGFYSDAVYSHGNILTWSYLLISAGSLYAHYRAEWHYYDSEIKSPLVKIASIACVLAAILYGVLWCKNIAEMNQIYNYITIISSVIYCSAVIGGHQLMVEFFKTEHPKVESYALSE